MQEKNKFVERKTLFLEQKDCNKALDFLVLITYALLRSYRMEKKTIFT
jgi:hypothetical protein